MRVPSRLLAVLLFVGIGMLALVVAGMLDWIVGVLFLSMEFLGEFIRSIFRHRRERRHLPTRARHATAASLHTVRHHRGLVRRRGRPRRNRAADRTPTPAPEKRMKLLVPVTHDDPDFLEFVLEECRSRQAELLLLFLRPLAVIPMGPALLPGLSEDDEARSLFERVEGEAGRIGVPMQSLYEITADRPATIGEVARRCEADVVLVPSSRGSRLTRFMGRDLSPSLLRALPERASLMIRAS